MAQVVAVKARLDAQRAQDEEDEAAALAFGDDDPEMIAAAERLQSMNRARIAKRRMALRREERRLAKLMAAHDDPNELKEDEVARVSLLFMHT